MLPPVREAAWLVDSKKKGQHSLALPLFPPFRQTLGKEGYGYHFFHLLVFSLMLASLYCFCCSVTVLLYIVSSMMGIDGNFFSIKFFSTNILLLQ